MWHKIPDLPNRIEGSMPAVSDGVYLVAFKGYECKQLGPVIHVIIFRQDGQAIAGWDEVQRIKAEIFGEEANAYEVYPPKDHTVNSFNARHLWIMKELNFGYRFRADTPNDVAAAEIKPVVWDN
jgi:hypothetical protein